MPIDVAHTLVPHDLIASNAKCCRYAVAVKQAQVIKERPKWDWAIKLGRDFCEALNTLGGCPISAWFTRLPLALNPVF
jgi:hypothetical protein